MSSEREDLWRDFARKFAEGQTKFTYFIVGLVYAVLGLSLQLKINSEWFIISWGVLLVAGLAGLATLFLDYYGDAIARDFFSGGLLSKRSDEEGLEFLYRLTIVDRWRDRGLIAIVLLFIIGSTGMMVSRLYSEWLPQGEQIYFRGGTMSLINWLSVSSLVLQLIGTLGVTFPIWGRRWLTGVETMLSAGGFTYKYSWMSIVVPLGVGVLSVGYVLGVFVSIRAME